MSRTTLLLQKELWKIENSVVAHGVNIELIHNSIYHWKCTISGLIDTTWSGGIFSLEIKFPQTYNETAPDIYFTTVPFHPNIDFHTGKWALGLIGIGRPCIEYLVDWVKDTSMISLLVQIQTLLAFPVIENAVNLQAVEVFEKSPRLYDRLVRDCVIASRRIKGTCVFANKKLDLG
jgi:ubiquitin-protein ligase